MTFVRNYHIREGHVRSWPKFTAMWSLGLQDKNCDLKVLDQELDTSTPTGRLIFHVLAVIGEFERELITERAREGRERAMAAGVKFGRKPKLPKRKERELLDMLESVVISKEGIARQFNVSRGTVYRLAAKLDKEFEEQTQAI